MLNIGVFVPVNRCGATLTDLTGEITSPNYPGSYQSGRDCTWKIVVTQGSHIELTFQVKKLVVFGGSFRLIKPHSWQVRISPMSIEHTILFREDEVRERIPMSHHSFLKSIFSSAKLF